MSAFLGLDTSNYTTSVAAYFSLEKEIIQKKKLLPVKEGSVGIRQSDAVFEHVRQIPEVLDDLFPLDMPQFSAIGASVRPRSNEDSYMPCFLVGKSMAMGIAKTQNIPFYEFSHQQGHIMAALYSAGKIDLIHKPFLAFHASGGTTELLQVFPEEESIIKEEVFGKTLDLNAGQVVDRVGVSLGVPFPAGPTLEALAGDSLTEFMHYSKTKPTLKGESCCLSGLENRCNQLKKEGASEQECAKFLLASLARTFIGMVEKAFLEKGKQSIVFAGGVLSNRLIQKEIRNSLGKLSEEIYFAEPEFSRDNAAGIALLTALRNERE